MAPLLFLGSAKGVSFAESDLRVGIAEGGAGVVMRRPLLASLEAFIEACAADPHFRHHLALEDVAIGLCLWMHGISLHHWTDPIDEVFFQISGGHPRERAGPRPFERAVRQHLSVVQCAFLVQGVEPHEVSLFHSLVQKSRRWFKSMPCVSGGFSHPEMTSLSLTGTVGDPLQPVFSPTVRRAMQDCLLDAAVLDVGPSALAGALPGAAAPGEGARAALLEEWLRPRPAAGPAFARLRRGGHGLCVFAHATNASAAAREDAAAALRSWAARGAERPPGVEVFLVGRAVRGPAEAVLRLRGDADLGYIHAVVRAIYLWRYLAAQHARECAWFAKVDIDTLVNLWALEARLREHFDAEEPHYLGATKLATLGSGRQIRFTHNVAVLSRGMLLRAGPWLEACMRDLATRKLGRGAGDIGLAHCFDMNGAPEAQQLGAQQEMMSSGMLRARGAGSGGRLVSGSGPCTLFVHPVHGADMIEVHRELGRLRAAAPGGAPRCDWPAAAPVPATAELKDAYLRTTQHDGPINCWMGDYTWETCCNPRQWGPAGNPQCWDDEHNHARCC